MASPEVGLARGGLGGQLSLCQARLDLLRLDVTQLRTGLNLHTRLLTSLQQDTRLIRAAINDVAKENVTPGEVEAIHQDLNRMQQQIAGLEVAVADLQRRG